MNRLALKSIPLFLLCIFTSSFVFGQTHEKCGTEIYREHLLQTDPQYKADVEHSEARLEKLFSRGFNRTKAQFTIPVVFHIMHTGEAVGTAYNISDAQIFSALDALNRDFANSEPGQPWGNPNGVDADIQFCLAQRDINGNPSTGIERHDTRGQSNYQNVGIELGGNDPQIKQFSRDQEGDIYPYTDYLNIWVVRDIDDQGSDNIVGGVPTFGGGTIGYATRPPGINPAIDGVVILYCATGHDPDGSLGYTLWNGSKTGDAMTHEVGHYLGLLHTFEDESCTEGNCATDGDLICDTPPTQRAGTSCGAPSCAGADTDNWMDYTGEPCTDRFTDGQVTRMHGIINNDRLSLLSSDGCLSVFQKDAELTAITSPMSDFSCSTNLLIEFEVKNQGSETITTLDVEYVIDAGAPVSKTFTVNLAPQAKTTLSFDPTTVSIATHTLDVRISSVNGGADERASNDSKSTTFDIITGANVTIEVEDYETQVDNEDYFEIRKKDGTVVFHVDLDDGVGQFGSYSEMFCLEPICYDFVLHDARFIPSNYGDPATGQAGRAARFTIKDYKGDVIASGFNNAPTTLTFIEPYEEIEEFCPPETVCSLPGASASGPTSAVCEGADFSLSASSGAGYTYAWTGPNSFTSTDQNPTITGATTSHAGTYTVTITSPDCSEDFTVDVSINAKPTISLGGATSTCGDVDITVSGANSYDWTRTTTIAGGMPASGTATGNITGTILNTGTTPVDETFTVIGTDGNSCESDAQDITITFNPTPDLTLTPNAIDVCTGEDISLAATSSVAGATFDWTRSNANISGLAMSGTGDISAATVTASALETDDIEYSASANGCTTSQTATLTVNPYPTLSHDVITNALCSEEAFDLNVAAAPAGASVSWSRANTTLTGMPNTGTGNITGGLKNATTADEDEVFTLSADLNGCVTDSVLDPITIKPQLEMTLSSNSPVDRGNDITIEATITSGSVTWTGPNGFTASGLTATKTVADFPDAGFYVATLTDGDCVRQDSIEVVVQAANCDIEVALSPAATVCENNQHTFTSTVTNAIGTPTYSWTGPNGFTSSTADITLLGAINEAGDYTLTANDGPFCSATETVTLTVTPGANTSISVIPNDTICIGDQIELTATGADSYLWEDGSTNPNRILTPAATATYSVEGTRGSCSSTADLQVVVLPVPNFSINPVGTADEGDNVNLTATPTQPNTTYTWTGPGGYTATGIGVTITGIDESQEGTYTLTATNAGGCSFSRTVTVNVTPQTCPVTINPTSPVACRGENLALSATVATSGTFTYSWSGPNGFSSTANPAQIINAQTADAGIYTVTATGTYCTSTNSVNVTVNDLNQVDLFINHPTQGGLKQDTTCANSGAITLLLSNLPLPNSSYTFSYRVAEIPGSTQTRSISPGQGSFTFQPNNGPGDYTIIVESITGTPAPQCPMVGDQVELHVLPVPTVSLSPASIDICENQSATITATLGGASRVNFTVEALSQDPVDYTFTENAGNFQFDVNPQGNGTVNYLITNIEDEDGKCQNISSSFVEVNIDEAPTGGISGPLSFCENVPYQIPIQNLSEEVIATYSIDGGVSQTQVMNPGDVFTNVLPPKATPYQFELISIQSTSPSACVTNVNQVIDLSINETPNATLAYTPPAACEGAEVNAQITVTSGAADYSITYTDKLGNTRTANLGTETTFDIPTFAAELGDKITLQSITSNVGDANCMANLNDTYPLTVHELPTGEFSNDVTICYNEEATIYLSLEGGVSGEYNVRYASSGKETALINLEDGDSIVVDPSETTTYTLLSVNDGRCNSLPINDPVVVTVVPKPEVFIYKTHNDSCAPLIADINFTSSVPLTECQWISGGDTVNGCFAQSMYIAESGLFDVELNAVSADGCTFTEVERGIIDAYPALVADFEFANLEPLDFLVNYTQVDNFSENAQSFEWLIGDSLIAQGSNPELNFPVDTPSTFPVTMKAYSRGICADSIVKSISVKDLMEVYVPNTFTPDEDGINETFGPTFTHNHFGRYEFYVFDKWGKEIFHSSTPGEEWDGVFEGKPMPSGVYMFRLHYASRFQATDVDQIGIVNLMR